MYVFTLVIVSESYDAQVADSIGLPVDEGLFGFKPFPEVGNMACLADSS